MQGFWQGRSSYYNYFRWAKELLNATARTRSLDLAYICGLYCNASDAADLLSGGKLQLREVERLKWKDSQ